MYVCQYRKYYPAESRRDVWLNIPMEEGWAMIAGGIALDAWTQFSGCSIDGYVGQAAAKIAEGMLK